MLYYRVSQSDPFRCFTNLTHLLIWHRNGLWIEKACFIVWVVYSNISHFFHDGLILLVLLNSSLEFFPYNHSLLAIVLRTLPQICLRRSLIVTEYWFLGNSIRLLSRHIFIFLKSCETAQLCTAVVWLAGQLETLEVNLASEHRVQFLKKLI